MSKLERMLDKLYELYPQLVDFDHRTGENALFEYFLDTFQQVLPLELRTNAYVVGHYLKQVLAALERLDDAPHRRRGSQSGWAGSDVIAEIILDAHAATSRSRS